MIIRYNDGGILTCSYVEIYRNTLMADGIYIVPIDDVISIEEDDGE